MISTLLLKIQRLVNIDISERITYNVKNKYLRYYKKYFGVSKTHLTDKMNVIFSSNRDEPISENHYFPHIFTEIEGNHICSTSKHTNVELIKNIEVGSDMNNEKLHILLKKTVLGDEGKYEIKTMYRMGYLKNEIIGCQKKSLAISLTEKIVEYQIEFESEELKIKYLLRKKKLLTEGRQFVILLNNRIVAWSKISDIDYNAANIAVYTDYNFRGRGYATQLVEEATKWCLDNNKLPVYWVDKTNKASFKVAQKIGFEVLFEEIAVKTVNGSKIV